MDTFFQNVYQGKTVFITGDTGLKGSWLAVWLWHLGAKVVGYALEPKHANDNYVICKLSDKITHITGDVRDEETLSRALRDHQPEFVFHLAAQALVIDSYKDPHTTFSTNVMGLVNLLEAIRKTPSVRVAVLIASDKCYENLERAHYYKETDPLGGQDPYSASKGAAEIIASSYARSFFEKNDTPHVATARAGNVIGGGDWSANRIFPDCMRALLSDQPIFIRRPESVRPWQHVLEPLSGYLTLGSLLSTEGKKYSGAWNFGPEGANSHSVKDLVEEIIAQWGSGRYVTEKQQNGPPEASLLMLDISKATRQLGWQPILDFKQSIRFSLEEYRADAMGQDGSFAMRINHIKDYTDWRCGKAKPKSKHYA